MCWVFARTSESERKEKYRMNSAWSILLQGPLKGGGPSDGNETQWVRKKTQIASLMWGKEMYERNDLALPRLSPRCGTPSQPVPGSPASTFPRLERGKGLAWSLLRGGPGNKGGGAVGALSYRKVTPGPRVWGYPLLLLDLSSNCEDAWQMSKPVSNRTCAVPQGAGRPNQSSGAWIELKPQRDRTQNEAKSMAPGRG